MMSLLPHQQHAHESLQHWVAIASKKLGHSLTVPQLRFNQRGKIAGSARLQSYEIRLNDTLLAQNTNLFCDEVIPHELSHLLVFKRYGRVRPHGNEWQLMMRDVMGRAPHVTHQMDVSAVKGRTYPYRCQCGPIELSVRRHNKVLRQQTVYHCRRCRQPLVSQVRAT